MSPRPVGAHRRPPIAGVIDEMRRQRDENARLREQLAELAHVVAELQELITWQDPTRDLDYMRSLFAEYGRGELARVTAERDALAAELRDRDRAWIEIARPIARGGPAHAQLEFLRWGPDGRCAFGAPKPTDYQGGPVAWADPAPESAVA
jgi:hypothetical protein